MTAKKLFHGMIIAIIVIVGLLVALVVWTTVRAARAHKEAKEGEESFLRERIKKARREAKETVAALLHRPEDEVPAPIVIDVTLEEPPFDDYPEEG